MVTRAKRRAHDARRIDMSREHSTTMVKIVFWRCLFDLFNAFAARISRRHPFVRA